jgi:hypothetical protein
MGQVSLTLLRKTAYGRLYYYPLCQDAEYILSLAKNGAHKRVAFAEKEVAKMVDLGWVLDIKEKE